MIYFSGSGSSSVLPSPSLNNGVPDLKRLETSEPAALPVFIEASEPAALPVFIEAAEPAAQPVFVEASEPAAQPVFMLYISAQRLHALSYSTKPEQPSQEAGEEVKLAPRDRSVYDAPESAKIVASIRN
jgi:hypothetical protein